MKPIFLFGVWNNERTKIIFLPSFQLVTRLNSQNRNETSLLMNSETLICIWILAFPIGIFQVSTPRKWRFLLYFSSLHDYGPPTTLISLLQTRWAKWSDVKNVLFIYSKCEKWVNWNIKTKCVTDFLLTVNSSSMKDYTCHYVVST